MLEKRNALITGSTSGIGLGVAHALADAGCRVALNGLATSQELAVLESAWLQKHPEQDFLYLAADLSRPEQAAGLIADAARQLGPIDILVNNAGIQHVAPVEDFPAEQWDRVLAVNLSAAFHTTKAVVPQMRARSWGRLINVASVHGLVGSVHKAAYVAAKHGLVGLTKVVALETAGSGITCNAICPGFVLTSLIQKQIESRAVHGLTEQDARNDLLVEKQPSRQFTTIEQLGRLALFLCSDAADNLTGAALPMDGGWTAQ